MRIPRNKPTIGQEEMNAQSAVLKSGWLIAGKQTEQFENAIKTSIGAKYALAVNSGHAALHLSLLALGVGKDDEVIVPTYSPGDLLNTIYYVGATPRPVDSEKDGFLIDIDQILKVISPKTKAMIIPHIFGFPVDMKRVKTYGVPVIEDCAQAIGSYYRSKPVGAYGDISIFSFYASKMITTGQGGMVVTNSKRYFLDMKDMIDYNSRDTYRVRYNYPMTDTSAALGNMQFEKLDAFITKRKAIAATYRQSLQGKNISFWPRNGDLHVNHFRFIIQFSTRDDREKAHAAFVAKEIGAFVPYKETEILHNALHLDANDFPNAQHFAETTLSLPIFPSMTDEEMTYVADAIHEIV